MQADVSRIEVHIDKNKKVFQDYIDGEEGVDYRKLPKGVSDPNHFDE
jgi:hypothetical protein